MSNEKTCPNCGSEIRPVLEGMYQCTICPWEDYHPDDIDWKASTKEAWDEITSLRTTVSKVIAQAQRIATSPPSPEAVSDEHARGMHEGYNKAGRNMVSYLNETHGGRALEGVVRRWALLPDGRREILMVLDGPIDGDTDPLEHGPDHITIILPDENP
jgi:hypothetical protein